LLAGCASTQLNYNTLDLASTVDSLVTKQVLDNLSKIIDNPLAIPAQVDLAAGTATTANSVTPTFTDPISQAATITNSVVSTVAATVTKARTDTLTSASGAKSLGIGASDTWTQTWTIAPVTGPDDLRRLRALYRYAFHGNPATLKAEYPLIKQTRTATIKMPPGSVECPTGKIWSDKQGRYVDSAGDCSESVPLQAVDPSFLELPGCVLCARFVSRKLYTYDTLPKTDIRHLFVNPRIPTGWLYWRNLPGAQNDFQPVVPADAVLLGVYGHHELFIRNGDQAKLSEFTLFIREATGQGASAGGGTSSSKGGGTGKALLIAPPSLVIPQ
jgi:hypothetical protein